MKADSLPAWLATQSQLRYAGSRWFYFDRLQVYLRAGQLKSYASDHRLLGVCIANVHVEDTHRRQGVFVQFVAELVALSRVRSYKELQLENVVSEEMLGYCEKHDMRKRRDQVEGPPCFWLPI